MNNFLIFTNFYKYLFTFYYLAGVFSSPIALMLTLPDRLSNVCKAVYREPVFHQLIASREHFDLIVIEAFMNDCMLPLVQHFQAPFIYLSALPPLPWMLDYTCSPLSFQQFPALCTDFTEEMNLPQRIVNVFLNVMVIYYRNWFILPRVDQVAAEAWINSTVPLSPVKEIERNLSLLITNTHPVINYQYFKSALIVEAGGLHLVPPRPLPQVRAFFVLLLSLATNLFYHKILKVGSGEFRQRVKRRWIYCPEFRLYPPRSQHAGGDAQNIRFRI